MLQFPAKRHLDFYRLQEYATLRSGCSVNPLPPHTWRTVPPGTAHAAGRITCLADLAGSEARAAEPCPHYAHHLRRSPGIDRAAQPGSGPQHARCLFPSLLLAPVMVPLHTPTDRTLHAL